MHEHALIETIAVALALAAVGGYVAARLRLPPLVGYLLTGIAVGPFTPGFVADMHLAPQLAEIGVILLMFGVGMHFSIGDLFAVRAVAIPGAVGQIVIATALGLGVAVAWGWPIAAGLVFGLALSVASTVVLLRALEDQGGVQSPEGRIAVGWLVVEDLVMVLVLALLPALARLAGGDAVAVSHADLATEIAITLGKIGALVAFMLIVGTRLFPWLLAQVERTGSRELFALAVIATAIGVAFAAAELFAASYALGAFVAGVVLHESDLDHRVAETLQPLQDAFAALFFVAVGMLLDPATLARRPLRVLLVVAIVVVGKSLAALVIVRVLRHPLRTALTVAAALSQIGELSFVLASLGERLGMLSSDAYQLIVAAALISITLNPLTFRVAARGAQSRTIASRL